MKKRIGRRRFNKKSVIFNPNRNYVQNAVEEFLDNGGKITKIELDESSYKDFMALKDAISVDRFLAGEE